MPVFLVWAACVLVAAPDASLPTREQIEADWLRQDYVRSLPARPTVRPSANQSPPDAKDDAAGGCNGVKNGNYGFHTDSDENPWWQVDLGKPWPLERVLVYNRCDGSVEARCARLKLLVSNDGNQWTEEYQHDGTVFRGIPDQQPLMISLRGVEARFVRVQLPGKTYLHLDEVEVYPSGSVENVALGKPAMQSSASQWSRLSEETALAPVEVTPMPPPVYNVRQVLGRGHELAADLRTMGVNVTGPENTLAEVEASLQALPADGPAEARRAMYFRGRWAVREMALANPRLDFDSIVFVKRAPGTFTHMCDQYYGWWSRPGGGLYVLSGFKTGQPTLRCLTESLPPGSVLRPDLSYDGRRVLFAHCKYYPGVREEPNKLDKQNIPEDAFYHLYEVNVDGTGLRRVTHGKYDDFDGRYLPSDEIVFLSTRRGSYVQCGTQTSATGLDGTQPDSYVRCGGGPERPVAVYTLHVMDAQGNNLRHISPFEMFEWTPSVDDEGRILYARWDYVDRNNMPYMSLWSTLPDGTNSRAIFKNYTTNPHCAFEARAIPDSQKLVFTGSGHHAQTGGCLVLLDPNKGTDGDTPMTRLTPETCFPETEGWPKSYYSSPYPLSEKHYLVAWSDQEMIGWPGPPEPVNGSGIYLFDAFGNLNLLYRDPTISSDCPLPVRARPRPKTVSSQVRWEGPQEGRILVGDVYEGLPTVPRGEIKRLRIVGVPPKNHPTMNEPAMGLTHDDPGKFVMGSVPVERDGSAFFRVPSGVTMFFQALDAQNVAVQTMRSATYVQPGQTLSCIGCHESRSMAPPAGRALALGREPSPITPGPEGSWPWDYASLVQPVLEEHCVACHKPGTEGERFDLTESKSYLTLSDFGKPSLRELVLEGYREGRSTPYGGIAQRSPLMAIVNQGHHDVKLDQSARERLTLWLDVYGQRLGSFSDQQADELRQLRREMAPMLSAW